YYLLNPFTNVYFVAAEETMNSNWLTRLFKLGGALTVKRTWRAEGQDVKRDRDVVDTQKIDKAVFPGSQGGPLEHAVAAKAVAFKEAMHPTFSAYAHQIVKNASALAEALAKHGFRLVSGGTDNHLMVVDLTPFDAELTGKEAQAVLDEAGITLNKNTIPNDPRSPFVTSGVRIGTPAVTTQGMKEAEMPEIARLIAEALRKRKDAAAVAGVKAEVAALCSRFPVYA
ncbi:MAG: hypothetical protein EBU84_09845, partial [Actinobacteria bacterium]|nr:hypothetical protein [Actinomycetota bacterium]